MTPQQKSAIRNLLQSPYWQIVMDLAKEFCVKVKETSPLRESEWDTLKEVIRQEGKVEGVNNFIQELYKIAQDNE